jgi:hypothetical protein
LSALRKSAVTSEFFVAKIWRCINCKADVKATQRKRLRPADIFVGMVHASVMSAAYQTRSLNVQPIVC